MRSTRALALLSLAAFAGCAESNAPKLDTTGPTNVPGRVVAVRVVGPLRIAIATTAQLQLNVLREGDSFYMAVSSAEVNWVSRDTTLLTVSAAGNAAAGSRVGSTYIVATREAMQDSILIAVYPGFEIFPDTTVIPLGLARTLVVESFDTRTGRTVLTASGWSSSSPEVASVDANGVVTAHASGWTTLRAQRAGYEVTATIRVPPPAPPVRFTQVGSGGSLHCALDEDGFAWCWGGIGIVPGRAVPERCVSYSSYILTVTVTFSRDVSWCSSIPVRVSDRKFTAIASSHDGLDQAIAVAADGELFRLTGSGPTPVAPGQRFTSVSIFPGPRVTCGVRVDSVAACGGSNFQGAIGLGTISVTEAFPTPVSGLPRVKQVEAGSCALTLDGEAYCWGRNNAFRLGIGPDSTNAGCWVVCVIKPTAVHTPTRFASIAVADDICGIALDGETWCWGPVPLQSPIPHATAGRPVHVPGIRFKTLYNRYASSFNWLCGIALDNLEYCLNKNTSTSTLESLYFFERTALNMRVIATTDRGCALSSDDGLVYCWGGGFSGALGNGTLSASGSIASPSRVSGQREPGATVRLRGQMP